MHTNELDLDLLRKINDSWAVLSAEYARAALIFKWLQEHDFFPRYDQYQNVLVGNNQDPLFMVAAHIDEIGVMVKEKVSETEVAADPIGYLPLSSIENAEITLHRGQNNVTGILSLDSSGEMLIHFKEKLGTWVEVGITGGFKKHFSTSDFQVIASSLDNVLGICVLLELLLQDPTLLEKGVFAFHRGEENGSIGAKTLLNNINPKFAIVLDYFPSIANQTDPKDRLPEVGRGPAVMYTASNYVIDQRMVELVNDVGQTNTFQPTFMQQFGDSEVPHFQVNGALGINIGIPADGYHSPSYSCVQSDIVDTIAFTKSLLSRLL